MPCVIIPTQNKTEFISQFKQKDSKYVNKSKELSKALVSTSVIQFHTQLSHRKYVLLAGISLFRNEELLHDKQKKKKKCSLMSKEYIFLCHHMHQVND